MFIKKMQINSPFTLNDSAVIVWLASTFTALDMNLFIGAITGVVGLGIQLYFKIQQNRRDQEKHDWEKNQNKKL